MPTAKNKESAEFYCYIICDRRKPGAFHYETDFGKVAVAYEPFYVGKGKGRRSERHEQYARTTERNTPLYNKIRSIHRAGHEVFVKRTRQYYDEASAHQLEVSLIAAIGRKDKKKGPLVNLTDGGEGTAGKVYTAKEKERLRQQSLVMHQTMSPEAKERRNKLISKNASETLQAKPKADRVRRATVGSKAAREAFDNMSQEEFDAYRAKLSQAAKEHKQRMTCEQKAEALQKNLAARAKHSPKRKALRNERHKATLASKTEAERKAISDKIKAAKAAMPLITCPHCELQSKNKTCMNRFHFDNCKFKPRS